MAFGDWKNIIEPSTYKKRETKMASFDNVNRFNNSDKIMQSTAAIQASNNAFGKQVLEMAKKNPGKFGIETAQSLENKRVAELNKTFSSLSDTAKARGDFVLQEPEKVEGFDEAMFRYKVNPFRRPEKGIKRVSSTLGKIGRFLKNTFEF